MKRKQLKPLILIIGLFILSILVLAQAQPIKKNNQGFDVKSWAPVLIGVAGFFFLVIQYIRRKKDEMQKKIAQLEAELKFENQQLYKQSMTDEARRKKTAELEAEERFKDQQQFKATRACPGIMRSLPLSLWVIQKKNLSSNKSKLPRKRGYILIGGERSHR